jgi:hypothetical protein
MNNTYSFVHLILVANLPAVCIKHLLTVLAISGSQNSYFLAICGPETALFWQFLVPYSWSRNLQNGAVSGASNCRLMAFLDIFLTDLFFVSIWP